MLLLSPGSIEIKNGVKVSFLAEIKRRIGFNYDLVIGIACSGESKINIPSKEMNHLK